MASMAFTGMERVFRRFSVSIGFLFNPQRSASQLLSRTKTYLKYGEKSLSGGSISEFRESLSFSNCRADLSRAEASNEAISVLIKSSSRIRSLETTACDFAFFLSDQIANMKVRMLVTQAV
jgi:hypothetical protein